MRDADFATPDLADLYRYGEPQSGSVVADDLQAKARRRLDALADATVPGDLDMPGFDFQDEGDSIFSIAVGDGRRIRFSWDDDHPCDVEYV